MIDRRHVLLTLAVALTQIAPADSQQRKSQRLIGFLGSSSSEANPRASAALRQALAEAGFIENHNLIIEHRWAHNDYERLAALASELVGLNVEVVIAAGGTVTPIAARKATTTIPVVFTGVSDPVQFGLVQSLNRPGGNLTGVSILGVELDAKRVELADGIAPPGTPIGAMVNPGRPEHMVQVETLRAAARTLGRQLVLLTAGSLNSIDEAFRIAESERIGALVVAADPFLFSARGRIVALVAKANTPAVFQWREFVEDGGLMSYGPSIVDAYRHVGHYVARILNGEKPAELPVIQTERISLTVNLKTARSLGIQLPASILLRADEVIE